MPDPRPLDGAEKRELVRLLVDAFPTPHALDELTDFHLGQRLSTLTTAGSDQRGLVREAVNWCLDRGGDTLARLVRGAVEERPQRADLRALAARLGYLAPANPQPPTSNPQPPSAPMNATQQQQLFRDMLALTDMHWVQLLADLGTTPAALPGATRLVKMQSLIREWAGSFWVLETAIQGQAQLQAAAEAAARRVEEGTRRVEEAAQRAEEAAWQAEAVPQAEEAQQVEVARQALSSRVVSILAFELGKYFALNQWERFNLAGAIAKYTQAIEREPQARHYSNRGLAYHRKKDYDRALADYTRAIELDPRSADFYWRRGVSYREKRDHDRALADFTRAIELAPQTGIYYYERGLSYKRKGNREAARRDFEQVVALGGVWAERASTELRAL